MGFSSLPGIAARLSQLECITAPLHACINKVVLAAALGLPLPAAADLSTLICTDLHDSDLTRAVLTVEMRTTQVLGLEVVTPGLPWSDPRQPETRRFPAGKTDVSPDLATAKDVAIRTIRDAEGELRIVDFAVSRPLALEIEGFTGSLMFHHGHFNAPTHASLYYTATGKTPAITPLVCRRY